MNKKTISVVIPCRNQDDKIGETIDHIIAESKKLSDFDVEIIFVNDRSSDNSVKIAEKHLLGYEHHQILHTDDKYVGNGKGLAVELGMTKAKGDYRLFMDADNSTKFEEIEKLIPYFDKYDIVLGTRYSKAVVVPSGNWFKSLWLAIVDVIQVLIYGHAKRYTAKTKQGRLRELVSRGGNLAFTVLLGQSFTDSRCGFKMYSKEATEKIFPICRIKTWDFDSEALVLAKKFGFSMVEVPVVWYDDAGASNFKLKDMLNAFKAIFQIRFNQLLRRYGKSPKKTGRSILKKIIIFLSALVLIVFCYLLYDIVACGYAREMKAFAPPSESVYFYGKRACRTTWDYKKLTTNKIGDLPASGKFIVLSKNENKELAAKLKERYLDITSYYANNGNKSFVAYEIDCASCSAR